MQRKKSVIHALVAAKQTNSAPVTKITIISRTSGALGYTMQADEGNHYLMSKEEIENKIATNQYLGGDTSLACSVETQVQIEKDVVELVKRQYEKAAQTMLQNEHSSYYGLVKDIAANVDSEKIVHFGMNLGYNSCTAGAAQIREEESCGYNIPWCVGIEAFPV